MAFPNKIQMTTEWLDLSGPMHNLVQWPKRTKHSRPDTEDDNWWRILSIETDLNGPGWNLKLESLDDGKQRDLPVSYVEFYQQPPGNFKNQPEGERSASVHLRRDQWDMLLNAALEGAGEVAPGEVEKVIDRVNLQLDNDTVAA